jgi:hypothetical protein
MLSSAEKITLAPVDQGKISKGIEKIAFWLRRSEFPSSRESHRFKRPIFPGIDSIYCFGGILSVTGLGFIGSAASFLVAAFI